MSGSGLCVEPGADGADSQTGGGALGKAVDAGGDCAKGEGGEADGCGELEAGEVAGDEVFGVFLCQPVPDNRADGVEDVGGGEGVSGGDLCVSGGAPLESHALFPQLPPCRLVDRPVHPAPAQAPCVGCIHYPVHLQPRDVAPHHRHHRVELWIVREERGFLGRHVESIKLSSPP